MIEQTVQALVFLLLVIGIGPLIIILLCIQRRDDPRLPPLPSQRSKPLPAKPGSKG